MGYYLDTERLATLTRHKRGTQNLREVAIEIGDVSPSTLSRVENGKMPDMETFLLLCDWLEVPPATLLRNEEEEQTSSLDPSSVLERQIRLDTNLDPATAHVLAALVKAAYRDLKKKHDHHRKEQAHPPGTNK